MKMKNILIFFLSGLFFHLVVQSWPQSEGLVPKKLQGAGSLFPHLQGAVLACATPWSCPMLGP